MKNMLSPDGGPPAANASAVDAAAQLGRDIANADAAPVPFDVTDSTAVIVRVHRDNEHVAVHDLERLLAAPQRPRGTVRLDDPTDFATYVERLTTAHTVVYVDESNARVTAVFNDHADADEPGWRDHCADYQARPDPDWQAWQAMNGALVPQNEFAEFVEDYAHTVVNPDAATMLEIATTFSARRNATFSRATRLDSGDVQLSWHDDTKATAGKAGNVPVPERITISVAPFRGVPAQQLTARLRYRINDGSLRIGFRLHRPNDVVRDAIGDVRATLAERLSAPVLLGRAPAIVSPR